MPEKNPPHDRSLPAALLRLWLLAEIALAGLYAWQGGLLWPYPGDWDAPPTRRAVTVVEGLYFFLFVPAAVIIGLRWQASRDSALAKLLLVYGAATAISFTAWAQATSLGEVRALFFADALISLLGVPIALRALSKG